MKPETHLQQHELTRSVIGAVYDAYNRLDSDSRRNTTNEQSRSNWESEVFRLSESRQGQFITMDELLDKVGVDAVRFFFLQKSADTHLNFDLSLAKEQSEKNPVYYVQYAHARICSILEKIEAPLAVGHSPLAKGKRQKMPK